QSRRLFTGAARTLLAVGLLPALSAGARGQQVMQYGFESRDPVWVPGAYDAAYKETAHQMTDEYCHGGQRAEVIRFQAEAGSFIHYTLDVGRAPVTEE